MRKAIITIPYPDKDNTESCHNLIGQIMGYYKPIHAWAIFYYLMERTGLGSMKAFMCIAILFFPHSILVEDVPEVKDAKT